MEKNEIKNSKKDTFFVKKTLKSSKFLHPSSNSSGSFFVTSSDKEEIMNKKPEERHKPRIQSEKNKNVSKVGNTKGVKFKKPFDKKKWRIQKYSKKYKLEQWENERKKTVLQEYYKQIKDEPKYDVQKIYEQYGEEDDNENNLNKDLQESRNEVQHESKVQLGSSKQKLKRFKKAGEQFQRLKEDAIKRNEEMANEKLKREEAKNQYKAQKLDKLKKLNKKTKKGQPIMKYRMEMLLEQIQKSMS